MLRVCRRADDAARPALKPKNAPYRELNGRARVNRMKKVYQKGAAMVAAPPSLVSTVMAVDPPCSIADSIAQNQKQREHQQLLLQQQQDIMVRLGAQQPLQVNCEPAAAAVPRNSEELADMADTLGSIDEDDVNQLLEWTQSLGEDPC